MAKSSVSPVEQIARFKAENERLRTLLAPHNDLLKAARRLIELKDGPRDSVYLAAKPEAWEALRRAAQRVVNGSQP